jgi:DNA-binding winged helix-turn-helix (wHTH) protein
LPDLQPIQFAEFTFDPGTRQLCRGGQEIHLSPKAFELLRILIAARPRALSKEELQAALWPDAFVTEANLPTLAKEIRAALEDDPRRPRFIRTLHGFGYAFATAAPEPGATDTRGTSTFWIVGDSPVRLSTGTNILGRDPDATVWFDRPGVSRRHAQIVISGDGAMLEDLGSTNGTWLRGERLTAPAPLGDGDEIRLGPAVVTFRVRRAAASTEAADNL